jgi:hypothetical protein
VGALDPLLVAVDTAQTKEKRVLFKSTFACHHSNATKR